MELRFGGRPEITVVSEQSPDSLHGLLKAISRRYVTPRPTFPPYKFPGSHSDEMRHQLFHWVAREWRYKNKLPAGDAELKAFDIFQLEGEFEAYVVENGHGFLEYGMTVEEVWAAQQTFWQAPATFIISEPYGKHITSSISDHRLVTSPIMVWVLAALCVNRYISSWINVLVHTPENGGHTIQLLGMQGVGFLHPRDVLVEPGWLTFHDPWPARSLVVSPSLNILENISNRPYWLISPEDLSKIIVGFIYPQKDMKVIDSFILTGCLQSIVKFPELDLWHEDPERPKELFPFLRENAGEPLPLDFESYVGLAEVSLLGSKMDVAHRLFEAAFKIKHSDATRNRIADIYKFFLRPEEEKTWRLRAF